MKDLIIYLVKGAFVTAWEGIKLIWKNLGKIAIYTLSLWVLFFVISNVAQAIERKNIVDEPATNFLNYTSFIVQNAREGEDVTFTLCRTHKENYQITGIRTVYVIPEGKTEPDKVFVYSKQVEGIVDKGNCQPYYIKHTEYHFAPGKYLMTLNVNFKVKYDIPKSVFTKSGIFTVYAQPDGTGTVEQQLNNLQQQLQDQQDIINSLIGTGQLRSPTTTTPQTSRNSSSTNQPIAEQGSGINANAEQKTEEVCQLNLILGIKLFCSRQPA
jgi:hypothetical protein